MLSLTIAQSALAAMTEATEGNISRYAMGHDPKEYKRFQSGEFWHRTDRPSMTGVYQSVLFSSMELSGANHFDAPAEWQAAVIAAFIHPANLMSACSWFVPQMLSTMTVSGLNGDEAQVEALPSTAEELFALVLTIKAHPESDVYKASFEKHINISLLETKK